MFSIFLILMLVLGVFLAGMFAEYFIMRNNPDLLTDVDAFVSKANNDVIVKLKKHLLQ